MIESFIEGRVRLRTSLLADAALAELLSSALMRIDGMQKVEVNPRTQGLLLEYDKKRLPLSRLIRAQPVFLRMRELERETSDTRLQSLKNLLEDLSQVLNDND
ncbi:MAG: hypothetical protein LBR61_13390 [Synergistaceae bacterium]|jgi:hypothetical protein|nr:hypothetical protein [Synergistaceae bacterium]